MPTMTPAEMLTFFGAAAFTLGPLLANMSVTPLLLPPKPSMPATPKVDGGASFSET